MIIVITPEENHPNEAELVNQMFREGLDLLHVRKPFFNGREIENFLNGIDQSFFSKIVLHQHFELAQNYRISRLHIKEKDRLDQLYLPYQEDYTLSTSVHDINGFNALKGGWEYAFLSPFFPSISKKGYGHQTTILQDCKERNNQAVKMVALGGIDERNMSELLNAKLDGIALLGAIWQNEQPLEVFKACRNMMNSYG